MIRRFSPPAGDESPCCGSCRHWAVTDDSGRAWKGCCMSRMTRDLGVECATEDAVEWLYGHWSWEHHDPCEEWEGQ